MADNSASFRDGSLTQGGVIGLSSTTISLTADNTIIDARMWAHINLESNNTTSTNRTFTLLNGVVDGQMLVMAFTAGSSFSAELISTGNVSMASSWKPLLGDTITLRWNARNSKWYQMGRGSLVKLADLASGVAPAYVVVFAGNYTTTGGNATEAQTVTGVASTDIVVATLKAQGITPRTLLTVAPTTSTITYVFSGDPSTDHIVAYQVLRAAA